MISGTIAYLVGSWLAVRVIAHDLARYRRLRWLYYRDQQRLAEMRWERETAFRS